MEGSLIRALRNAIFILTAIASCSQLVNAQTNSWTGPTSGYWEDMNWSLGTLPAINQTILFTNAGWKALAIGPSTVQNDPQSLNIQSLTISSPSNSVNTLLMNYSGFQTTLTLNSLTVGSNSAVVMYSSSLQASNGISLGGNFVQDTFSVVTNSYLDVGDIGPANYNLNSGALFSSTESVGSTFPSVFTQLDGTNNAQSSLEIGYEDPSYVTIPPSTWPPPPTSGSYVLSNGVLVASEVNIWGDGTMQQSGGTQTINGALNLQGTICYYEEREFGYVVQGMIRAGCSLDGGLMSAGAINVNGVATMEQSGGTNQTGELTITGTRGLAFETVRTSYNLYGGQLLVSNITVNWQSWFAQGGGTCQAGAITLINGWFTQSGGTCQAGAITLGGLGVLSGGQLNVQNFQLNHGQFHHVRGGTLNVSGILSMGGGTWDVETGGGEHLGQLQLNTFSYPSFLELPNNPCVLNFSDSSSLAWSNSATLVVTNWSGSLYGGFQQQIIFGSNSSALTPQQLSRIQFKNPAGLPPGTYPARILATGEIVPDTGAPLPSKFLSTGMTNLALQLNLGGNIGQNYQIDVSTDLVNWIPWTNQFNSNGTISIYDRDATNFPKRFYRARPLP